MNQDIMNQDIFTFCSLFYNATLIPLHYYVREENVFSIPSLPISLILAEAYKTEPLEKMAPVGYYVSKEFSYYGIIRKQDADEFLIIGPVISTPLSANSIRSLMSTLSLSGDKEKELSAFLEHLPIMTFYQFLNTLAFIHFGLNHETIDVLDFFKMKNIIQKGAVATLHSLNLYKTKEEQNFHNTWHFEQEYLKYIEEGNTAKLSELLNRPANLREGQVADNSLRQAKNIAISAITLITRSSIVGGLDIETAYQLSDTYIAQLEQMQSVASIYQSNYTAIFDFTERVAASKIPQGISTDIYACIQYVKEHTNEAILVSDVAKAVDRSKSYLSRCFKAEMGFDLSSFIMRCKLEEAKSLLSFTDKSISEISNYLCFSSQGYFQNVFKKKYGITPNGYRKMGK